MEGIADRDRKAIERDLSLAWRMEVFARTKMLEPLGHYLDQLRPQSAEEKQAKILAFFQDSKARGAPVKITHVKPDNDPGEE